MCVNGCMACLGINEYVHVGWWMGLGRYKCGLVVLSVCECSYVNVNGYMWVGGFVLLCMCGYEWVYVGWRVCLHVSVLMGVWMCMSGYEWGWVGINVVGLPYVTVYGWRQDKLVKKLYISFFCWLYYVFIICNFLILDLDCKI